MIDMCSQDNGGCARHAQCSQTGVNVSCACAAGYRGDGYICEPIDRCADGRNGDCSQHAHCISTGPVSAAPGAGDIRLPGRRAQLAALGQPCDSVPPTAVPCPSAPVPSAAALILRVLTTRQGLCCCDGSGEVMPRPFFPTLSKEQKLCQLCHSWAVLGAPGWFFKDNAGHFCRGTKVDHRRPEYGTGSMV